MTYHTRRKIDVLTAKSSGTPNLLFGVISASALVPPESSMRPFAILVGKKPGAIAVVKMCSGPSSTARFLVSDNAAALLAEYPKVALAPRLPTPKPAMEAVMTIRDGSS